MDEPQILERIAEVSELAKEGERERTVGDLPRQSVWVRERRREDARDRQ